MSFAETDGGPEILIPTIIDGVKVSNEAAKAHYYQTGQHFGVFATPDEADAFAQWLHEQQAKQIAADPTAQYKSSVAYHSMQGVPGDKNFRR